MNIDDNIQRVRAYRQLNRLTITAYARMAGLSEATIRPMDKPSWSPNVKTIRALEKIIPSDWMPPQGWKAEQQDPNADQPADKSAQVNHTAPEVDGRLTGDRQDDGSDQKSLSSYEEDSPAGDDGEGEPQT